MNKRSLSLAAALLIAVVSSSQTLFTYGKYSVSANEFLRAFNKNNTDRTAGKDKAIRSYLDLYINSRLKVQEAYERRYDTLPHIKAEVENLRSQIIENYMSDPETMNRLINEAFTRSQKDIYAAHIFISAPSNDTTAAAKQVQDIYNRLQKGEDFGALAASFSQDPSAKFNKGEIGWITVFTLPYAFETALYALPAGKHSAVTRSKAGYHIFKNIRERKAVGKMKARQILLAFPPNADETIKKQVAKTADSLYQRIMAGEDFGKLASALSNDYVTAATGGTMPDFGVGRYDSEFENKVWALTKDEAVTKPFATSHGYHIVKRVAVVPVPANPADKNFEAELKQKINQDQRWQTARDVIYKRVAKEAPLKHSEYHKKMLWALSDSLLDNKVSGLVNSMSRESVLFSVGKKDIKADDWIIYAQRHRYAPGKNSPRPYEEIMEEFVNMTLLQYYRDNLEQFNEEFRYQMNEFRDGNLFFEIMQNEIWNKAHLDSAALLSLYEKNKKTYNWQQSADAVIFFCADAGIASTLHDQLKKNPANWRMMAEALSEKVIADSARFEWPQLPNLNKMLPKNGMFTSPLVNETDNTASFAYIVKVHTQPEPRTFEEAKGLVINDYQALLEEQWIKDLRKKYPVVIDQKVLSGLSK